MSVKVIYVAGVPATGKTTLFKQIRARLFPTFTEFKDGKVRGIENGCYKMLGVFDGSTFEGTDRLSMTVIDDAIAYIKRLDKADARSVVFVEGDRLFNYRFISESKAVLILLDAQPEVLKNRHLERGDTQTAIFLQSRRTKIENFARKYGVSRVYNNDERDAHKILSAIIKIAESYVEGV